MVSRKRDTNRSWPVAVAVFVAACAVWVYRRFIPDKRTTSQVRQVEKARQRGIRRELRGLEKEVATPGTSSEQSGAPIHS